MITGDDNKSYGDAQHKFDGDHETWKSYTERLTQYFAANDVESADEQHAILLSVCGPISTYREHSGTSEAY